MIEKQYQTDIDPQTKCINRVALLTELAQRIINDKSMKSADLADFFEAISDSYWAISQELRSAGQLKSMRPE